MAAQSQSSEGQSQSRHGQSQSDDRRPASPPPSSVFADYRPLGGSYDELFAGSGAAHDQARPLVSMLEGIGRAELDKRQQLAGSAFHKGGITFSVYSDNRGVERIFPFDVIPRLVSAADWSLLQRGLIQRIQALNAFLGDVYGEQRIIREGVIPAELIMGSAGYLPEMAGIEPRGGVYVHVAGIDIVRGPGGEFLVLEDNVRTPSGVSYVLENRSMMKRVLPRIFAQIGVRPVDAYPTRLRSALASLSPVPEDDSRLVLLTPGPFNSAYFEHSFLARRMGCELVQGSDLFVHDCRVWVKTTSGPSRVDVIYRRVDDAFIDPGVFNPGSLLGVRGLVDVYARGNVTLANALGNGVADDKAIYPYVPDMIRFYLAQEPLLAQIQTFICAHDGDCRHVLDNLGSMVVKSVDASGGYGMLLGPAADRATIDEFAGRIRENPRGYIAQPLIELSTCPTLTADGVAPRRVDLRPYIVTGSSTWVLPGGLTRVALVEGSYVVNSSQGGGSKDTWVLEETT